MPAPVDLHIHSDRSSDGEYPPDEIVRIAAEKGLAAISISDHDTVDAYPDVLEIGMKLGVLVIPGLELTTQFKGREYHLLLPFIRWDSNKVTDLVKDVAERRRNEARDRVARLQSLGWNICWEDVLAEAGTQPPIGVSVAIAAIKKARENGNGLYRKYIDNETGMPLPMKFYLDYLAHGKPASVPRRSLDLIQVLESVAETGGVPVLAHPGAYFMNASPDDIGELKEAGLQGLEVFSTYHDPVITEYYLKIADANDLVATAGSDFHGVVKPDISIGIISQSDFRMVDDLSRRRR